MRKPVKQRRSAEDRYRFVERVARRVMERVDARRAEETRKGLSFDYLRGDLHTHTCYSDGFGEVSESVATMSARGLDFLFITDHNTVRQKVECRGHRNVWWGQEPGAGFSSRRCHSSRRRRRKPWCARVVSTVLNAWRNSSGWG